MQSWNTEQITAALAELRQPFPLDVVQVKIGATAEKDGKPIGLALMYADWWTGYLPILNRVIGPGNWHIELLPWGATRVIAKLNAFGGQLIHWSSGEGDESDDNTGTSAEIQAKKRVCAEALGLGLYLYSAPKIWGTLTHNGRGAAFISGEADRIKHTAYQRMGLYEPGAPPTERTTTRIAPTPPLTRRPPADQLNRARAALAEVEQRTAVRMPVTRKSTPAPTRKVLITGSMAEQIVRTIAEITACGPAGRQGVDAIGTSLGLFDLLTMQQRDLLNGKLTRDDGEEILGSLRDLQQRLQRPSPRA
jgi:hypothetical protein